jgi:hypothetical protein
MRRTFVRLGHDLLRFHVLAAFLLLSGAAFAATDSMSCNVSLPSKHVELSRDDRNTSSELKLARPIAAGAQIDLDVCSGDVGLIASKDGSLHMIITLLQPTAQHMAGDYLEALEINPNKATVHLHLPKAAHAQVTLEIPITVPGINVNLARGRFMLRADQLGGQRMINVGYGEVKLVGGDDAYQSLEVNVGLGSLHDHRQGGEDHHLIVAHSFAGSGKGEIQVNVGMGHVDLEPSQAQPI